MAAAAAVLVVGGVTFRLLEGGPRREAGPDRIVGSAPGKAPPRSAPPASPATSPAAPAAAPTDALASREAAGSPERAAKRSRQEAPAPAAEASGAGPAAVAAGRVREDAVPADFPPGATGAFVSLDFRSGTAYRVNATGCAARHAPYATFEIPGTLIGLETGVIADPGEPWRWDAQVATRVGEPRMTQWLARFDYGNQDVSGGLDRFWLGSSLRISPDEQAAFLAKLQRGAFPVSKANLDRVRESLTQESGPGFRLVARTGSSDDGEGWLVGWVEKPGGGCAFALHLEAPSNEEMARVRPGLARDFLRRAGCLPR
jgi:beta-lactamase class D